MNREAAVLWERSIKALAVAKHDISIDANSSASRAYYAAFYAVSALFALEGKTFIKHSAVEGAVHRDLVKTGRWSKDYGDDYSALREARSTADYGGEAHVSDIAAKESIEAAERIVKAVHTENPVIFQI